MDLANIIDDYKRGQKGKFLSALRSFPLGDARSFPIINKHRIIAILNIARSLKDTGEDRKVLRHLYTIVSLSASRLTDDAERCH